jgi:hypothetical protein
MFHDIDWFVQNMGLAIARVDVLSLKNNEVQPKKLKNFLG